MAGVRAETLDITSGLPTPCAVSGRGAGGPEGWMPAPNVAIVFPQADVGPLAVPPARTVTRWGAFALVEAGPRGPSGLDDVLSASEGWVVRPACLASTGGASWRDGAAVVIESCGDAVGPCARGDWIALLIPARSLPALSERLAARAGQPVTGVAAQLLAGHLHNLGRLLPTAQAADLPVCTEATRALLEVCLGPPAAPQWHSQGAAQIRQRARVEQVIRDNLHSARLDTMRICALSGVSRSALYRLFGESGGVAAYVRSLRLALIRTDLGDPSLAHLPVARIAEQRGLYCTPSFNRAFRRAFGRTPGEVRGEALMQATRSDPDTAC